MNQPGDILPTYTRIMRLYRYRLRCSGSRGYNPPPLSCNPTVGLTWRKYALNRVRRNNGQESTIAQEPVNVKIARIFANNILGQISRSNAVIFIGIVRNLFLNTKSICNLHEARCALKRNYIN